MDLDSQDMMKSQIQIFGCIIIFIIIFIDAAWLNLLLDGSCHKKQL
jgi:hypothetical protein